MIPPQPETEFEDSVPQTEIQPPRQKDRWSWLLIALVALMGGAVVLWRLFTPAANQEPKAANARLPGIPVKVATAQLGLIEDSSEYIASFKSRRSVSLQPRVQGQVTQIFVRSGDRLKQGDPIIQIDAREQQAEVSSFNAAVEAARSQLENARATLASLEAQKISNLADVRLSQQDYDRYASLAVQGAVSRQTKDQYANKLAVAKATLQATESRIQAQKAIISQAEKSIQQALANLKQKTVQLQYYKITAPFAGTVGDIPVKVGDFVNTSTQLATITQNQPLEVNISIPLELASQLRKGTPVEILDAQGRSLGISRVFFISPNIINNTQTVLVKALFDNAKEQLRSDEYTRVRVIWNQRPGVLIPITAVTRVAGQNFVYVVQMQKILPGENFNR
jgi:multidrug efflux pump subunit AcrA (membrane-fusion protein)